MIAGLEIRDRSTQDGAPIVRLYGAAFPGEELRPLTAALHAMPTGVLSLVAMREASLAGHVVLTECGLRGQDRRMALLGPLAVAPGAQRQGVGSALVRAGLQRLAGRGVDRVLVLGDPAYYGRLGFAREDAVRPPYPLPDAWRDAWQSRRLTGSDAQRIAGDLDVPEPWRRPELWGVAHP